MASVRERFAAPWSKGVTGLTVGCSLVFLALPPLFHWVLPLDPASRLVVQAMPLALLVWMALYAVLGYELEGRTLWVVRPLWVTRVDLHELEEVKFEPGAVGWATRRVWGSGGWFGFFGWFRKGDDGMVRAWVTDPEKTVVVRTGGETVVVSPEDPERFMRALEGGGKG